MDIQPLHYLATKRAQLNSWLERQEKLNAVEQREDWKRAKGVSDIATLDQVWVPLLFPLNETCI